MASIASSRRRAMTVWFAIVGGVVLALSGLGHAALQRRIDAVLSKTTEPRESLDTISMSLGDWTGRDIPIDQEILEIATFDDFYINRMYRQADDTQASVFVGYVGRPRARMGHRPDVCYAAQGWTQLDEQRLTIETDGHPPIEAVLYSFKPPNGQAGRLRVLATYLVNGRYTNDAANFTSWNQRRVDVFGVHQPAYLARVQVSMVGRPDESELPLLKDLTARLSIAVLDCMPELDDVQASTEHTEQAPVKNAAGAPA